MNKFTQGDNLLNIFQVYTIWFFNEEFISKNNNNKRIKIFFIDLSPDA